MGRAKKRVHRPLPVGSDEDQALRRRRFAFARNGREGDVAGPDVMAEHLAELVVRHLADKAAAPSEHGHSGDRVGSRAPTDFPPWAHFRIEIGGALCADQLHRALGQILGRKKFFVGCCQHVHDGIADRNNIQAGCGHALNPFCFAKRVA